MHFWKELWANYVIQKKQRLDFKKNICETHEAWIALENLQETVYT